ncbi:MAG: hypothetical protein AAB897_00075 [Patescibacteria group bacterium]
MIIKTSINKISGRDGFVALTSAIIIGVILMAVTLSLSFTGFFARFNILETEFKERSFALAEACVDSALLKLALDSGYSGGETISVGDYTCDVIFVAEEATGELTIKTQAEYPQIGAERTVTNLVFVVEETSLDIISWEEVASHT